MSLQYTAPFSSADSLAAIKEKCPRFALALDQGATLTTALRRSGLEFWREGRIEEAAQMLGLAVSAAADDPVVLAEFGCIQRQLGKRAEAMQCFLNSLYLDCSQVQVWLNAANLSSEAGDRDAAREAYAQALQLEPTCSEAAVGLGLIYVERRDHAAGAMLLAQAVEHGGGTGPVYACLGQALYLLGEFARSSAAFASAARLCPGDASILKRLARARLIEAALGGSAEQALAEYARTAGAHAEDLLTVGRVAFQALGGFDKTDAAIRLGRALLRLAPGDPVIGFHLDALMDEPRERAPDQYLTACFDKYAEQFDKHLVEVLGYHVPEEMHALLLRARRNFARILDLGCGTGLAARNLASFRGTLTGVDISRGMLEKARQRKCYDRLVEREAVDYLSHCDESFDLIVALDVTIYFGDLAPLFAAAAARLSPDGVLAFSHETDDCASYRLRHCGRFAHAPAYIETLARENFSVAASVSTTLRWEANKPVEGKLVLLRRC